VRPDQTRILLLAANALLNPGVVIAGIVGAGAEVETYLGLMPYTRVTDVALYDEDEATAFAIWDRQVEPLRRQGIGLSLARSGRLAARGADLVLVLTRAAARQVEPTWLAVGSVVVNLTSAPLDRRVIRRADLVLAGAQLDAVLAGSTPGRVNARDRIVVELSWYPPADAARDGDEIRRR
jgi:ornithine cyclodeaminase/alanine dehydrogenase-like protein (mu-crystallin family)